MAKTKEERPSGSSVEEDGSGDSAAAAARSLGVKKLSLQKQTMDGKLTRLTTSGTDLDETGEFKDGHMFSVTSVCRKQNRATSKGKHSEEAVKSKDSRHEGLVVPRKKKIVESKKKKRIEKAAEGDENKDRTGKIVKDIDGRQQSVKTGKHGDTDSPGNMTGPRAVPNIRCCPTCKHSMADEVFRDHIKECLQQFHIASKDRRRKVEVMVAEEEEKIERRRNKFLEKGNGGDVVTDEDYFLCQICQKDLSHMNSQRRTQHMNRCMDEAQVKDNKLEEKPESGACAQVIILDCPMCGKPLKTESSRKVHLKQCARMLNVTTEMMLQAVKAQEEEHNVKIAAGIAPQPIRAIPKKKSAAGAQGKKQTKKKAKGSMDEDTQLAMALSSSLADEETRKEQALIGQLNLRGIGNIAQGKDKEAKRTRKKKTQQGRPPSLLLQLSKTEAQQRIADKVTQLIVPQASVREPCSTPPIVDSRLTDLPGTKVFVVEQENSQVVSTLWRRTALHAAFGQDVRSLYYTEALMPPVCMSDIVVGSKLKHVSQIPGRRKSEELEQNSQGHMVMSQTSEDVASTPTAMLLAELAAEAGDSSCDVKTAADDNSFEVPDEGAAVTPDDLREASGFCPEEPVHINKLMSDEAMSALQRNYLSLVDQEHLSDVAIETKDQNVVHAHQLILSVRCPELLKLTRRGVVHLLNSSRDAVLTVMKFVYGGEICLQPSLIAEVKALAQQLCVTDLAAYCETASQELQQADKETDMRTDIQTKGTDKREPKSSHRLTSIDDICQEMFSDSDFDLDNQGETNACKEGGDSKSDEDEWREVYCSQRQQLQHRQSLGDVVVEDEVGDIGRDEGELDTVEYVEEKVAVAGSIHRPDPVDKPAQACTERKPVGKSFMTAPHSGEEELFSEDEEAGIDLLVESSGSDKYDHDTNVQDNCDPDIADPEKDVTTMRRDRTCDQGGKPSDLGFETRKANKKRLHGSDDFEIIQSGSSSSMEDEDNNDDQGTREEAKSRPVAVSPSTSPDKTEPSQKVEKRKRESSDQDVMASPVLGRKISSCRLTPRAQQSHKRLKIVTPNRDKLSPGHKQTDRSASKGASSPSVTKVLSDKYMKMSTPRDSSGPGHSVVEQDSLYITPIPKQRQRSTFMLVTPALANQCQDLPMDGDFVATPVGRIVSNKSGQEVLVHLDGSLMKQADSGKSESDDQTEDCPRTACSYVENENNVISRSIDASTVAPPETGAESGSGQSPHTKSSDWKPCSKSSLSRRSASPDKKSIGSSDSDLEIVGDNFQLLSQVSVSPKFPNKFSFKKISSHTRKLSRKRRPNLDPLHKGDTGDGMQLETDIHNRQEEEDTNVFVTVVGMVTESGDATEKESTEKNCSPPKTDQEADVGDVVDDPGDVWDGFDDLDAACHIDPVFDADTEESPQKRSSATTPGKKRYTHKRHVSIDMTEGSLATTGTSAEHGHSSSRLMSDDDDSLPSPGRVDTGEATLDFEVPDADSFLWNDDNAPAMEPSPKLHGNKGRQLQQVSDFQTPVTTKPRKTTRKLVPPSPFTPMPNYDDMNTPRLKQEVGKFGVRPVGKKRMVGLLKDIYHKTHQYETDSDYDPKNNSPQKPADRPSISTVAKDCAGDRPSMFSVTKDETGTKTSKSTVAKDGARDRPSKSKDGVRGRPSKFSVAKDGAGDHPNKSSLMKDGAKGRPSKCSVGHGGQYSYVSAPESSASEEGSSQRSVTSSQNSGCSEVPEESFMVDDDDISASQQVNQQDIQQKLITFIRQRSDIHTKLMMYEPLELDWLKREIQEAGIKCPMQKLMDFLDEKCLTFTMKKMTKRNTNRRQLKRKKKVRLPAAAV
ncbi:structure-specific endonuclease subunit SLX4-like [Haliotis asinina]|uniref:structure-specific endonuclease subunit SLX4-like n=1 Tax=Haliotis asinina TaxID=109174 RepID=UPI0035319D59